MISVNLLNLLQNKTKLSLSTSNLEDQISVHQAVKDNKTKKLKFMLQNGNDINIRDKNDLTSLHTAIKKRYNHKCPPDFNTTWS